MRYCEQRTLAESIKLKNQAQKAGKAVTKDLTTGAASGKLTHDLKNLSKVGQEELVAADALESQAEALVKEAKALRGKDVQDKVVSEAGVAGAEM